MHADIGTTANIYAHPDTTDLEAALRARGEDYGMASRNRSDRNRAFCGEYGGGGNRTRVRSRTVKSLSKHSLPLDFASRPVGRRTYRLASRS